MPSPILDEDLVYVDVLVNQDPEFVVEVESTQDAAVEGGEPEVFVVEVYDMGPQGIQGEQGEQGPQGLPGEVGPQGVQGEQGPAGETPVISYPHNQGTPSTTWPIPHNLGRRPTSVFVLDSGGNEHIPAAIEHVDLNNMILHFVFPFGGTADVS